MTSPVLLFRTLFSRFILFSHNATYLEWGPVNSIRYRAPDISNQKLVARPKRVAFTHFAHRGFPITTGNLFLKYFISPINYRIRSECARQGTDQLA